jgi:hypothetical protein
VGGWFTNRQMNFKRWGDVWSIGREEVFEENEPSQGSNITNRGVE